MAQLFDHLVGAGQQPRRNGQRERFGGPQVNDQLELGRRLHGKLARLGALEDLVDVIRGLAKLLREVGAVRDKAA